MKKILPLIILLIFSSCSENQKKQEHTNKINYSELITNTIGNREVDNFLKKLGSDFKYSSGYGSKRHQYKTKGVELFFTESDTLTGIAIYTKDFPANINLPFEIKKTDTRNEIEKKLGKPDKFYVEPYGLSFYYLEKNLIVYFKSTDTININNELGNISMINLKNHRKSKKK